jgi:hypothetical protein
MQQAERVVKVRLGGWIAGQLEWVGAYEGVPVVEIVRRAIYVYLKDNLIAPPGVLPAAGPARALPGGGFGPFADPAQGVPSSSPPSSPPAPPLSPPSLSPPAPLVGTPGEADSAEPADSGGSGLLFPAPPEPGAPPSPTSPPPPPPPEPPASPESLTPSPAPPPLLLFPCLARRTGEPPQEWPLTAGQVAQWEEAFPGMDVLGEARKARQWLLANHLKTYAGLKTFLFRWLCKAQDSGRFMRHDPGRSGGSGNAGGIGGAGGSGGSGGSGGMGDAGALPAAVPRTLHEAFGFASWEEWEATLRQHFEGCELDQELRRLAEIRVRWEAERG